MVNQMSFPLETMKTLNEGNCRDLQSIHIHTVKAFVAGTNTLPAREALRTFLKLTEEQMEAAVNEAQEIVSPPQFAMGAFIPPELAWQEGKTTEVIALVNFALRTRLHLFNEARLPAIVQPENAALIQEAEDLLHWLGVPVPELR